MEDRVNWMIGSFLDKPMEERSDLRVLFGVRERVQEVKREL